MTALRTPLCDLLGIEVPILAFSHTPAVVVEVSRAGGMGVLGAAKFDPDDLETALGWIDEHIEGRPYGVDVVMAASRVGDEEAALRDRIPREHREFVESLRQRFGIPPLPEERRRRPHLTGTHPRARRQVDVALAHPIRLLVSALGPAPADLVAEAHRRGLLVGGMTGDPEHAWAHREAGADLVVAQGTEAGGHTGQIATMVLVPAVVDAVSPLPVLAAGGIARGRQVAAALALGAVGVWTGSVWLTTEESDVDPVVKAKLLAARARDAVRSRCSTGKPVRQLRTPWVEAWEAPEAPRPLPMPLQELLVHDVVRAITEHRIEPLMTSPVGQVVGDLRTVRPVAAVFADLVDECLETLAALRSLGDTAPAALGETSS